MGLKPAWRLSLLQLVDPFGWHALDFGKATYVREKLAHFESMTWSEILVKGKKHNHSINVEDLCPAARERLRNIRQDDVEDLVSLSLSGRERVWGILEGAGVLKVLWWDPDHRVCPSVKKHT